MNTNSIIKSLNLTDGEVLTLEKLADRMEFEAFSGAAGVEECNVDMCGIYVDAGDCLDCGTLVCDCDGPVGYINCHPYKG